jgi:hypothetical protein
MLNGKKFLKQADIGLVKNNCGKIKRTSQTRTLFDCDMYERIESWSFNESVSHLFVVLYVNFIESGVYYYSLIDLLF